MQSRSPEVRHMSIAGLTLSTLLIAACGGGQAGDSAQGALLASPQSSPASPASEVGKETSSPAASDVTDDLATTPDMLAMLAAGSYQFDAPSEIDTPAAGTPPPESPSRSTAVAAVNADGSSGSGAVAVATAMTAVGTWVQPVTSVAAKAPAGTMAPKALSAGIQGKDLVVQISGNDISAPRYVGLQCQGVNSDMATHTTVSVRDGTGAAAQRFGAALSGGDTVFRHELALSDTLPAGTPPRCEQLVFPSASSGIKDGEMFWHAVEIWADDWSSSTDEQLILQWHQNDPRLSMNPLLSAILKGDKLRLELRTSAANPATRASATVFALANLPWKPKQWNTIVLQGRISPAGSQQPMVRMWLNGTQVLDRKAPIGYALQDKAYNYVKWGIYKWTDGNPWNASYPVRSVMTRNVLLVKDPGAAYTASMITTALRTR